MRDAPAWTTHTHQVRPGETILVNRDEEDGEGGDVGLHRARTGEAVTLNEKQSQMDSESRSASGSGSATADGDGLTRDADGNVVDEKQESGARRRNVYEYDEERGDRAEMEQDDHDAHGERAGRDDARRARSGGRRTPPVAEYREGDDLIIERDNRETGEVRFSLFAGQINSKADMSSLMCKSSNTISAQTKSPLFTRSRIPNR
jgi:hypothetical protein